METCVRLRACFEAVEGIWGVGESLTLEMRMLMSHFDAILQEKRTLHHTGCCSPPKHFLSAADSRVSDLPNMCRRRIKGRRPEAEPQIFLVSKFKMRTWTAVSLLQVPTTSPRIQQHEPLGVTRVLQRQAHLGRFIPEYITARHLHCSII